MPLSIQWNWAKPNVVAPQTMAEKNNLNENLMQLGSAIASAKERRYQRQRQEKLDEMAQEDRQRRIDEEERQKKLYGETAELIRGKRAERDALVSKRDEILRQIDTLKAEIGG